MGFSKASTKLAFVAALAAAFALLPVTGGEASKKTCKVRGSHTTYQTRLLRGFAIFGPITRGRHYEGLRLLPKERKEDEDRSRERSEAGLHVEAGRPVPPVYQLLSPGRGIAAPAGRQVRGAQVPRRDPREGRRHLRLLATPSGGIAFILDVFTPEGESSSRPVYRRAQGRDRQARVYEAHSPAGRPTHDPSLKRKGDVVSWRIHEAHVPSS